MLYVPDIEIPRGDYNAWGFPKQGLSFWGSLSIVRIIVFWGLYWGPIVFGKYQI